MIRHFITPLGQIKTEKYNLHRHTISGSDLFKYAPAGQQYRLCMITEHAGKMELFPANASKKGISVNTTLILGRNPEKTFEHLVC